MRVLVVDDSALMRRHLRKILEDEGHEVLVARDGEDALRLVAAENPDVITLDINMPVMDGLTCLTHIMRDYPRPVVMISSLTEKGALATFEALELGAVDYVPKPGGTVSHNILEVAREIVTKVKAARRARLRTGHRPRRTSAGSEVGKGREPPQPAPSTASEGASVRPGRSVRPSGPRGLVLIGVSTGGPSTLECILPNLPRSFPLPVLVAQHMPSSFTRVFADRMNGLCELDVRELDRPTPLTPGTIHIAKGDFDAIVEERLGRPVALAVPMDPSLLWHPSVDRMVRSATKTYQPSELIAVQLTGMGDDGAAAMAELQKLGGRTIAESEETATVFGMPKELIELGGAEVVLPVDQIAPTLVRWSALAGLRSAERKDRHAHQT